MTYDITCCGCSLTATAETVDAVLDRQEQHQADTGSHHLFEFKLVDR